MFEQLRDKKPATMGSDARAPIFVPIFRFFRVRDGGRRDQSKDQTSKIHRSIEIQAPNVSRRLLVNRTLRFGSSLDVGCWMLDVSAGLPPRPPSLTSVSHSLSS